MSSRSLKNTGDTNRSETILGTMIIIDEGNIKVNIDKLLQEDPSKAKDLIMQFALEANLGYGRNKKGIEYFQKIYPAEYLVTNITKVSIPFQIKAYMIKLLTSLYIDDWPNYIFRKMRCFRMHPSIDENVIEDEFQFNQLNLNLINELLEYFINYIDEFTNQSISQNLVIDKFDVELIKCLKFMTAFGMLTHRTNTFQKGDLCKVIKYGGFMLEIFSKEKLMHGIERLESVAHRDTTIEDFLMSNPLQTSANDIKNWLFNKKDWSNNMLLLNPSLGFLDTTELLESRIKVVKEIFNIFHHLKLIRQYDLMSLISGNFQIKLNLHLKKLNFNNTKDYDYTVTDIMKNIKNVLLNNDETVSKSKDIMPPIAEIFKIAGKQYFDKASPEDKEYLHEEFKLLIVDTFNNVIKNEPIKQTIMLFFIRIYSEKSELVRNIDKMLLVYNQDEWNFYQWTRSEIFSFSRKADKSSLWLIEDSKFDDLKYIKKLLSGLTKLKKSLYYKGAITVDDSNKYYIEFVKKNNGKYQKLHFSQDNYVLEVCTFVQDVFRNLKVYEHLLYFISGNTSLLKLVRTIKQQENETEYGLKVKSINKIFGKGFQILKGMVEHNEENQNILWKYKEFMVFSELGGTPQDGELDLIYSIIQNNDKVVSERSISGFISNLQHRLGHKCNFIILCEILNKLISYESEDNVKLFLLKEILQRYQLLDAGLQLTLDDYTTSVNLKEVLMNVLFNSINYKSELGTTTLIYSSDTFISYFPLNNMFSHFQESIDTFEKLYESESKSTKMDYINICEREQQVLVNLYSAMYLNKNLDSFNPLDIAKYFTSSFLPAYEHKLDIILDEDYDMNSLNLSQAMLLGNNLQLLGSRARFLIDDLDSVDNYLYQKVLQYSNQLENQLYDIDGKARHLIIKCKQSDSEKLKNYFIDHTPFNNYEEFKDFESENSDNNTNM